MIRYDKSLPPADVALAPEAQQWLTPTWNQSPPDLSEVLVLLAETEDDDGTQVEVTVSDHHVGTLTAADARDFRPVLAAAKAEGKLAAGVAIRDQDTRGDWALHVYRPERPAE
jgi:hypothetical protein